MSSSTIACWSTTRPSTVWTGCNACSPTSLELPTSNKQELAGKNPGASACGGRLRWAYLSGVRKQLEGDTFPIEPAFAAVIHRTERKRRQDYCHCAPGLQFWRRHPGRGDFFIGPPPPLLIRTREHAGWHHSLILLPRLRAAVVAIRGACRKKSAPFPRGRAPLLRCRAHGERCWPCFCCCDCCCWPSI